MGAIYSCAGRGRAIGRGFFLASLLIGALLPVRLSANEARDLTVLVSIKPLHSLVAGVMAGAGEPHLLLEGSASPHSFQLKPSAARLLHQADLVVWVGPLLEASLSRPIDSLSEPSKLLTMMASPGMELLERRDGHAHHDGDGHHAGHEAHEHGKEHEPGEEHAHDDSGHGAKGEEMKRNGGAVNVAVGANPDAHLWLSIGNSARFVREIAARLAALDPARASLYADNAEKMQQQLTALEAGLSALLGPLKGRRYMVFHDAYQYLTHAVGLEFAGAVTFDPSVPASAGHLTALRQRLQAGGAHCVFAEPQYNRRIISALVDGTGVRVATLDPLGAEIKPGPQAYAEMMNRLAAAMKSCLMP